jgi:hypothetical protein
LYQLRSKITTSPAAGKCWMYRRTYICVFSRSVGVGRATTRKTRGLTRSVIRLIVPPFPAVSRPSNTTQILALARIEEQPPFTRHDVGKTTKRELALRARRERAG